MIRFCLFLAFLIPFPVFAEGTLTLVPTYASYRIGEVFEVKVIADTDGQPISAAEAEIDFDPGALTVKSISTDGSIFATFSTEPEFSNEKGKIRLAGWTAEPFTGSDGHLLTITFTPLRNMVADVRFASGAILTADSRGSNILASMRSALYSIEPQEVAVVEPPPRGEVAGVDTEPPAPPSFEEYEESLQEGERILVRGNTIPSALVTIFSSYDGSVVETSMVSAADGSFTYVSDEGTEEGIYRITAEVEIPSGERSERSDRILITVRPELVGVAAVASFAGEMAPLAALVVFGVLIGGYLYHRHALARLRARHDH